MNKKNNQPTHRLLLKIRDNSKSILIDEKGQQRIPIKWVEVQEISLGSITQPNKEIFEIRFEPINYEKDEDENRGADFFNKFFGGLK